MTLLYRDISHPILDPHILARSSSTMSEEKPATKPTRDPQALSSEYHKARKQLMLWAGILFIWELVGIDLEKAKEMGGNAGAIINAIKSPQAIPWVLLILVAYFLFKTTVEWHQCSGSRRALRVSRVDFGSAWIVTALAYALYAYQAISRIQFADIVASLKGQSFVLGAVAGLFGEHFIKLFFSGENRFLRKNKILWIWYVIVPGSFILAIPIGIFRGNLNGLYVIIGLAMGAAFGFLTSYVINRTLGVTKA